VICVNLNGDLRMRGGTVIQQTEPEPVPLADPEEPRARRFPFPFLDGGQRKPPRPQAMAAPGIAAVMIDAFNITQDRISRSRLAGDPPDIMIAPKLARIGLFEFHRAAECIELGRQAAERALPDIRDYLDAASELPEPRDPPQAVAI
ncbi:MAG: hypothetical protein JO048_06515, partial [Methylobacteriaceae bacterium]|nr:hypothetical protein [Methylobacteriaceae bacterium]